MKFLGTQMCRKLHEIPLMENLFFSFEISQHMNHCEVRLLSSHIVKWTFIPQILLNSKPQNLIIVLWEIFCETGV